MIEPADPLKEVALLAAALCDGEITRQEAARLEQLAHGSDDARRCFLEYLQLHGELYWDHAAAVRARTPARAEAAVGRRSAAARPRWRGRFAGWAAIAVAASLLVAVTWWCVGNPWAAPEAPTSTSVAVARFVGSVDAEWSGQQQALSPGQELASGQTLLLRSGVAEIELIRGAEVILEGPAELTLQSPQRVELHAGSLTARVPKEAAGFEVRSPAVTVVDLGTEFGLLVERSGASEVHVLTGAVRLEPGSRPLGPMSAGLQAGEAVRVSPRAAAGEPQLRQIALRPDRFVRSTADLQAGSVAKLRRLVARHPRLIHHFTFEGFAPGQTYRDRRGSLDLREVVMWQGRGDGSLRNAVRGFDATTRAVAPFRASEDGNTNGVGLESEATFDPPPEMTVELLLRLDLPERTAGAVFTAVATRESQRCCGFLVMAVEHGQMAHLMDGDAPWTEAQGDLAFVAGDWYYVVSTFRVESGQTRVNSYVADLSRRERSLHWVVRNQLAAGVPAASRLGIGKALDASLVHAYPWAGQLDEIAIYDTILSNNTLEEHLRAVLAAR